MQKKNEAAACASMGINIVCVWVWAHFMMQYYAFLCCQWIFIVFISYYTTRISCFLLLPKPIAVFFFFTAIIFGCCFVTHLHSPYRFQSKYNFIHTKWKLQQHQKWLQFVIYCVNSRTDDEWTSFRRALLWSLVCYLGYKMLTESEIVCCNS